MLIHRFASAQPDGTNPLLVRHSNWNDLHKLKISTLAADTLLDTTYGVILAASGAGTITLTLPTAAGNQGLTYLIKKSDTALGTVLVQPQAGQTIDSWPSFPLLTQNALCEIASDGANWQLLSPRQHQSPTITLTPAQLTNLTITQPTMIQAPPPSFATNPLRITAILRFNTTPYVVPATRVLWLFGPIALANFVGIITPTNGFFDQPSDQVSQAIASDSLQLNGTTISWAALPLSAGIVGAADMTAGDSNLELTITYTLVKL